MLLYIEPHLYIYIYIYYAPIYLVHFNLLSLIWFSLVHFEQIWSIRSKLVQFHIIWSISTHLNLLWLCFACSTHLPTCSRYFFIFSPLHLKSPFTYPPVDLWSWLSFVPYLVVHLLVFPFFWVSLFEPVIRPRHSCT